MLSFKNNQNVQPLYDYYVETDLDSFDDQPVDYSKKYSDQDSYDDCRQTKSALKSTQFPPEVSQTIKQSGNDEVKVYCIEGTPLTISYASSLSDLREVGTSNSTEKSDLKHSFPSVNDNDSSDSFDLDIKKDIDSPDSKKGESPLSKEKDDSKEGKSVSFRNSTDISKASSPLMFSRSSSIGSLNSFEQHSIIDDRSSVSVFSALTSGLISPSDLPDSPGEIMSPALTDKDNSPKIDVTKIGSDNECDNIDLEEKESIELDDTIDNEIDVISTHVQLSKTKVCNPINSDRNSDDDEILVEQLEISNDSLEIDEVFDNPDYENNSFILQNEEDLREQLSKSDDESDGDDILLQQCIQRGLTDVKEKCDVNVCKKLEYSPHSHDVPAPHIIIKKELILDDGDLKPETNIALTKESFNKICVTSTRLEMKTAEVLKSDDDSDEDDELLKRCIQLGMPENTSNRTVTSTESFVKTRYSAHPVNYNSEKELLNQTCTKSNDDCYDNSDRDDIILEQCIQQGMPSALSKEKISSTLCKMTCHSAPVKPSASQVQLKTKSESYQPYHSSGYHVSPLPCMQYRMQPKLNDKIGEDSNLAGVRQLSPVKKVSKNVPRKMSSIKTDVDSDGDENDPLLQHCIQMGMPKEPSEKKYVFRKAEFDTSQLMFHPVNNMRDNCPDGTSDGDEDELLEKCIRAGMPSPKAKDAQNRLHAPQPGQACRKWPVASRSFIPETSAECNKKFNHYKLPQNTPYATVHSSTAWVSNTSVIDVDSMRIYRTEDTPILSPSASISDLSSLSFNESFLNNSRNSDCSSDSDDDDELLQRCIRSGMPEAKRAVA